MTAGSVVLYTLLFALGYLRAYLAGLGMGCNGSSENREYSNQFGLVVRQILTRNGTGTVNIGVSMN